MRTLYAISVHKQAFDTIAICHIGLIYIKSRNNNRIYLNKWIKKFFLPRLEASKMQRRPIGRAHLSADIKRALGSEGEKAGTSENVQQDIIGRTYSLEKRYPPFYLICEITKYNMQTSLVSVYGLHTQMCSPKSKEQYYVQPSFFIFSKMKRFCSIKNMHFL